MRIAEFFDQFICIGCGFRMVFGIQIFVGVLGHIGTENGLSLGCYHLGDRSRTCGEYRVYLLHHEYVVEALGTGHCIAYVLEVSDGVLLSVDIVGDVAVQTCTDL